jgi:hypothetical protein
MIRHDGLRQQVLQPAPYSAIYLQSAQSLSRFSYSNARKRRYWRNKSMLTGAIQFGPMSGWCDIGLFAVGVSLVALGLRTVTAAVMVFILQNVTKITD